MAELSSEAAVGVAKDLLKVRNSEHGELSRIHEYLEGDCIPGYIPRDAKEEYRWIAKQSNVNILPKIVDAHAQSLYVSGYRSPEDETTNLPAWVDHWQANRMDARQTGTHRATLAYGASYVQVLPGDTAPAWSPFTPRDMTCVYEDATNDEWPQWALTCDREGDKLSMTVLGPEYRYILTAKNVDSTPDLVAVERHGVPWTPVVRFLSEYTLDDESRGLVAPLIPIQDQINLTTFNGLVSQVAGAFPQKWATGMDIPRDEQGRPVEPFKAAVTRLWVGEGEGTRFGSFDATDLKGYLDFREDSIRLACTIGSVPPHTVLGALANLSAEAMAAAEIQKTRAEDEYRILFGESWEQVFRLSRFIGGDSSAVSDTAAEVVWKDTEARSWSQVVDAAVKLRSLGMPMAFVAETLGVTPQQMPQLLDDIAAEADMAAVSQAKAFGVTGMTVDGHVADPGMTDGQVA